MQPQMLSAWTRTRSGRDTAIAARVLFQTAIYGSRAARAFSHLTVTVACQARPHVLRNVHQHSNALILPGLEELIWLMVRIVKISTPVHAVHARMASVSLLSAAMVWSVAAKSANVLQGLTAGSVPTANWLRASSVHRIQATGLVATPTGCLPPPQHNARCPTRRRDTAMPACALHHTAQYVLVSVATLSHLTVSVARLGTRASGNAGHQAQRTAMILQICLLELLWLMVRFVSRTG